MAGPFDEYIAAAPRARRQPSNITTGRVVQDAGLGAADMLTFGWGDEIAGAINDDWKWAWRDASRRAEQENPLSYYGGMAAGGFIPGAGLLSVANRVGKALPVAGGAFRAGSRALSSPGLGLGGRIAAGSMLGGVGAGVAGAGFAEEGGRVQGAVNAVPFGLALGAAAPVASKALGGLFSKPTPPARGPVIEGARPMMADDMSAAPGVANVTDGALEDFIRTMQRGPRRTADDIEAYVAEGVADPGRGRTFMDAMGRAGTKKARALYSQPGEAADLIEAQMLERARGARGRLESGVSGVRDGDALAALNDQIDDIAKAELGPWFADVNQAAAQRVLDNLARRPSVAKALAAADDRIEEHVASGLLGAEARGSAAHRLHYARIILQNGAKDPTRLTTSMRNMDNADLIASSNAISAGLDNAAPGYKAALDRLRSRLQPRAMVKAARVAQRTDRSNVAGNMLGNQQVRRAVETDLPDFGKALRTEDELFRNSSRVLSGSDTAANVGELLSQGVAANAAPSISGAVQAAWRNTFGQIGRELFGDLSEQRANELVRLMLQKVDDPDPATQAKVRAFLTRLRDRMQQMERRSAVDARNAAEVGGGIAGNRVEEF